MIPRYVLVLSLGVVGAALLIAAAAEGRFDRLPEQQYFPASFAVPAVICENGTPGAPDSVKLPVASAAEASWYSTQLRAAQERSLYVASLAPGAASTRTYRFTWLRSFHQPLIVRIDEHASGKVGLTATMLSGAGGYSPGRVASRLERVLKPEEAAAFKEILASSKVFELQPVDCRLGMDGSTWIIEANERGAYRYVSRWSPEAGPVRDVGIAMLQLTGWRVEPIY